MRFEEMCFNKETAEDADYAREHLRLCRATGRLFWKKAPKHQPQSLVGTEAGWYDNDGYRLLSLRSQSHRAHRLVWLLAYGKWPEKMIDHINGNGADNRLCNLRVSSHRRNARNTFHHRAGKTEGVTFNKARRKWRSHIQIDKKQYYLGSYDTPEEAAAIYASVADNPDKLSLVNKIRSTLPTTGER